MGVDAMSSERRSMREAQGPGPTAQQQYWMEFYQEYHEEVARYFARHVKCPQDVEDLVQMVFLRQLYAYWRRKKTSLPASIASAPVEDYAASVMEADWDSDPLEQLSSREMQEVMASLMTCLSPVLAEALQLRFVHGLPLDEAAVRAGCSREALKKRLLRAKQSLTGYLMAG
jgi:DNA-directed RNA polymerase specialized sigma24 family protein